MDHLLVVANETVAGQALIDAIRRRAELKRGPAEDGGLVTVVCPINKPREGYVVYEDTRRAAAGRRLERTLAALREAGIAAHGMVADAEPVDAVRDALATLEPPVTGIIVSTHPASRSAWARRHVVERIQKVARGLPVEHVVVDLQAERGGEANVLVIANETVLGRSLLDRIRERARRSPASFLIVSPQSDPGLSDHRQAERRLRRAVAELRAAGVEAHGQIAHPDPHTAAMHAVRDERVDEIIVSTFPEQRSSSWLRRDVVARIRRDTGKPVEHILVEPHQVRVRTL
jgi:predicted deacetylase